MTLGISDRPVYGTCQKCNTEYSEVFQYKPNYWICKANECWAEELEHDSGRAELMKQALTDYQKLVRGTQVI